MHHVAIMKKSWRLLEKILSGEKTCESRWYKFRRPPWNMVKSGDTIWFKNSGEPVTVKAQVTKVLQFANLTPEKTKMILNKYGKNDLGLDSDFPDDLWRYFENKNYCVLVFFDRVEKIIPFDIDKSGFGAMAAWLCVGDIESIKKDREKRSSKS